MRILIANTQKKFLIPVVKIKSAVQKACRHLKFNPNELSIVFVGTKRMRRLNRDYLGHDYTTDVLTFRHGEIVVCPGIARRNAKHHKNSIQQEIMLFKKFRECQEPFKIMLDSGLFSFKGGHAVVHYNLDGKIMKIETTQIPYTRNRALDRIKE